MANHKFGVVGKIKISVRMLEDDGDFAIVSTVTFSGHTIALGVKIVKEDCEIYSDEKRFDDLISEVIKKLEEKMVVMSLRKERKETPQLSC